MSQDTTTLQRPSLSFRLVALAATASFVLAACGAVAGSGDDLATGDDGTTAGRSSDEAKESSDEGEDPSSDDGEETVEPVQTTATTEPAPIEMPELIGLTEAEARVELTNLGLDEPAITSRESFEPPGTVLEQVPSEGRAITGTVSLVVAESIPPMPTFVGLVIADVRAWAEPRGITVREETRLVTDESPGTVLEQVPAAGAEASQELLVVLAESPTILDVTNLTAVDNSCFDTEDIEMNGNLFPETLVFKAVYRTCGSGFVAYNLSRDWSALQFTLGLDDRHSSDAAVQIEITADDQIVYTNTVVFGETIDAEVDVTNVLRLQISTAKLSGGATRLGLANLRLLGGSATSGE